MAGLVKLVAPMDYPGAAISKNRTWLAGRRGKGQMNREASRWKRDLTDALTVAALGAGVRALALPLTVVVQPRYVNKREATDPHNLTELAADAVQEFCGLNDRDYTTIARAPVYGAAIPSITITVIARRADGVAAATAATPGTEMRKERRRECGDVRAAAAPAAATSVGDPIGERKGKVTPSSSRSPRSPRAAATPGQ